MLGYPRSVIGRMIDGMPSNRCVACSGIGRVPGAQQGAAMQYTKCAVCNGAGKVDLTPSTHSVNPAFIHSTSSYCGDPASERMDWAICQLTIPRAKQVLIIEYCERGTQAAKARELGITQGRYSQVLSESLDALGANLVIP